VRKTGQHVEEVISEITAAVGLFDLDEYYNENVSYVIDDLKRKALQVFLERIKVSEFM
jgi:hypothetical protein